MQTVMETCIDYDRSTCIRFRGFIYFYNSTWPVANQAVCIFNSIKLKAGPSNTNLNSFVRL